MNELLHHIGKRLKSFLCVATADQAGEVLFGGGDCSVADGVLAERCTKCGLPFDKDGNCPRCHDGVPIADTQAPEIEPEDTPAILARKAIESELQAINLYEQMAERVDNAQFKKVMLDIAGEEKVHVGEFQQLLKEFDPRLVSDLLKGKQEAEQLTGDAFKEEEHPRDEDGKFTSGSGGDPSGPGMKKKESGAKLPPHIEKLKIPPAWTDVTYSEDPHADLLAKGKDAKGREQRIYSDVFVEKQQKAKYERVKALLQIFPEISKQNAGTQDAENRDCLALIMSTGVRPGSDTDTGAKKKAYGATTLEGRHVDVSPDGSVTLKFTGKKGVDLTIPVTDPEIAASLKERKKKAGDSAKLFNTNSAKLQKHSHSLDAGRFKPKDFRTRLASDTAANMVKSSPVPKDEKSYKKQVLAIAKAVSQKLGNTPAIALQSYIDPNVFEEWKKAI